MASSITETIFNAVNSRFDEEKQAASSFLRSEAQKNYESVKEARLETIRQINKELKAEADSDRPNQDVINALTKMLTDHGDI